MFGVLNINKPKDFTSHDVVNKLRKILNIRKIGHTGTLDPLATGVLPVCIGKATKLIQYFETDKSYIAYIKLGQTTDTYDIEGQILNTQNVEFNLAEITGKLNKFLGEIEQIPPIYSSVHYKGKRLYEYARANQTVESIPPRKVKVSSIKFIGVEAQDTNNPIIVTDIDCSGGTYIRAIAHDLGKILGYGACLHDLVRTKSGKFEIDNSYTLEQIEEFKNTDNLEQVVIKPTNVLSLPEYVINESEAYKIKTGQFIEPSDSFNLPDDSRVQLIENGKLFAIAKYKDKKICPVNVFF